MNPTSNVQVEQESGQSVAVIYNGIKYSQAVKEALLKQNLRVVQLESETQALSVLEKPTYIFFFASKQLPLSLLKTQFGEAKETSAKIILILDNLDSFDEKLIVGGEQSKIGVVEIRGDLSGSQLENFISKVIRQTFSSRITERQVVIGGLREVEKFIPKKDVIEKPTYKKTSFNHKLLGVIFALITLFVLVVAPIGVLGSSSLLAFSSLAKTKDLLFLGQFEMAAQQAQISKARFETSKEILKSMAEPVQFIGMSKPIEKIYDFLILGESAAESAGHISQIATKMSGLTRNVLSGSTSDLLSLVLELRGEISPVSQNLGLIEAQVLGVKTEKVDSFLSFLGFPVDKLEKYIKEIPTVRKTISNIESVLSVLPEIAPVKEKRTYLVVFQNSAELRATGGFIGSYGIITIDNGQLVNWQINDIYSADGQLRGQISPPDEILHYAGQPSWFMRDANWSADWPLSAKRLEWFLEKETGQKVDGVIGVSLGTVYKLLKATGPIDVPDLNDTISSDNFFNKAEYSAEINFFPGSTQKRDYLGTVAKVLLDKIINGKNNDFPALSRAMIDALEQKDVIFYFNSPNIQKVFSQNGWAGEISPEHCQKKGDNCIAVIDSNLGANKANYFVQKGISVGSAIAKDGAIDTSITINYKNNSPSETWPGGRYKNYLRILVPVGAKMTEFSLGDGRTPLISPILTEKELAKVGNQQFLVLQTMEGLYSSYGALVEVPIGQTKKVTFRFRHPYKLLISADNPTFVMTFIKQPGTDKDPLDFVVDFPSFLVPIEPLAFPQKLIYNSDLETNRTFEIFFKRQI